MTPHPANAPVTIQDFDREMTERERRKTPISLDAARKGKATCATHGEKMRSSVTSWNADTGKNVVRLTYRCGCQEVRPLK